MEDVGDPLPLLLLGDREPGGETLNLGRPLLDPALERRVEVPDLVLGHLPRGDVREDDGEPPQGRVSDGRRVHVEPPAERLRPVLEPGRFAAEGDPGERLDPVVFEARDELARGPPDDVGRDPAHRRERRVDVEEPVVERLPVVVDHHLAEGEPLVDGREQRPVALLALAEGRPGPGQLGDVDGERDGRLRLAVGATDDRGRLAHPHGRPVRAGVPLLDRERGPVRPHPPEQLDVLGDVVRVRERLHRGPGERGLVAAR